MTNSIKKVGRYFHQPIFNAQSQRIPSANFLAAVALIVMAMQLALAPATAQSLWTNQLGMRFHQVPAGTFNMGQAPAGYGVFWDSSPIHPVTISRAFWMSEVEVPNSIFEMYQPSHIRGTNAAVSADSAPAVNVTWNDAAGFIAWLNQNYPPSQPGMVYRLPTEAEWEYAAVNATQYQLSQMESAAEEWTSDWYGPYPGNAQTDPVGAQSGDFKVTRGASYLPGNWNTSYNNPGVRMGSLPQDINPIIGFRLVLGPVLTTTPTPPTAPAQWAVDVSQTTNTWTPSVPANVPYFAEPISYVNLPTSYTGPFFSHNHVPALAYCPNGDLLAIWISCLTEDGREMTVLGSRLRKGATTWDPPSVFWDTPGRNDASPALWQDSKDGKLYHFNSFAIDGDWSYQALYFRTSTNNGATWSPMAPVNPIHDYRNVPIASLIRTSNGQLVVPCDAVPGANGGTAVHISSDNGATWTDPGLGKPVPSFVQGGTGAWVAGIHAGVIETTRGGSKVLLAYGRKDNINATMPQSISTDGGKTWSYSASAFEGIGNARRSVLRQLDSGALLNISFTVGMTFTNATGGTYTGIGMYASLSYDGGVTWPVRKLMTDGVTRTMNGWGWEGNFTMDATHAETLAYLTAVQTPDSMIHLLSSGVYYKFNQRWVETPYGTPPPPPAPTLSSMPGQTISPNNATPAIPFTVTQSSSSASNLTLTATSSNPTLVPNANIIFGGSGANRTVTVTPAPNQTGTATITITATDSTGSSSLNFAVTVQYQPPAISSIPAQIISMNSATPALPVTVGDAQVPASSLTLSANSSNTNLVPKANIVFGGSGTNRTVTVTPAANQTGMAIVTITVSDGVASNATSFTLNVPAASSSPPGQNVNIALEAEAGIITSPMAVYTNAQPPAVCYVASPTANSGSDSFLVNIPTAGTYVIWARVLSPTYASDSFFVSVDGGPEDVYDDAEGIWSNSWQWTAVNGRNGTSTPLTLNPRTFNLGQGVHTITFRAREAGATLDRILISNNLGSAPNDVVAQNVSLTASPNTTTQFPQSTFLNQAINMFSDPLTISAVSTNSKGTVSLSGNVILYSPPAGFVGTDVFTYTLSNTMGGSSSATATITVQSPSSATGSIKLLPDHTVSLQFQGTADISYNLQVSTNLINWTTISSAVAGSNGIVTFTDTSVTNNAQRYYRATN